MTYTRNAPDDFEVKGQAFGVVFAGGIIHGPTPVDERGLGGSTKEKIAFMVVPGPKSPYFPEVDFEMEGARGFRDREIGFWSIYAETEAHALAIVEHLRKAGGV